MDSVAVIPKYNLNEEQEKKLILREYRASVTRFETQIKAG